MSAKPSTSARSVALPATAAAAQLARREIAATPGISGKLGYKALLLASEVIAVYVQDADPHPDARLLLRIGVSDDRVRIEVSGPAPDISPDTLLHSREAPSLGGMGLQIVDRMAASWGVDGEHDETTWFELPRER